MPIEGGVRAVAEVCNNRMRELSAMDQTWLVQEPQPVESPSNQQEQMLMEG